MMTFMRLIRHDDYREPNRYDPIKQQSAVLARAVLPEGNAATTRSGKRLSAEFMNRLFSGKGNPARAGFTGIATEIRVSEPAQPHTYTQGKKPQLTEDYSGPAAGPSPKASSSEAFGLEPAPAPSKGKKAKQAANGKSSRRFSMLPVHRPQIRPDESLRIFGGKNRPDLD